MPRESSLPILRTARMPNYSNIRTERYRAWPNWLRVTVPALLEWPARYLVPVGELVCRSGLSSYPAAVGGVEKWEAFFAFHFSMPRSCFHLPSCWCRWSVAQRGVWPHGVVIDPPPFSQHLHLLQRVENFSVQKLVTQLGVEALTVPVLPGRAGFDVQRLGAD